MGMALGYPGEQPEIRLQLRGVAWMTRKTVLYCLTLYGDTGNAFI
jgi:hypothetical protein